eukprot:scaffold15534_cov57-Phaeocystis_antarctica.AAC.9
MFSVYCRILALDACNVQDLGYRSLVSETSIMMPRRHPHGAPSRVALSRQGAARECGPGPSQQLFKSIHLFRHARDSTHRTGQLTDVRLDCVRSRAGRSPDSTTP